MANGAISAPALSFPRETFAKLTPGPFLQAHLKQPNQTRPNGRLPHDFREPVINTGSLTHSNGSAVVRSGDTAVVCGIRAEILTASDIPHPPSEDLHEDDLIESVGLLVPNIEMSTGCSPAHLPGNPPSTAAQALSYRLLSLLHSSNIVDPKDLIIQATLPKTEDDPPDEDPQQVTKAYWTLYIDILCISLDGNAFDTAWLATVAALQDVVLPKAWWDQDREAILCSPRPAEASRLRLNIIPAVSTFAVFSTASALKQDDEAQNWILADPDAMEEELANESLTVAVAPTSSSTSGVLAIEKSGGAVIDGVAMASCIQLAEARHQTLLDLLRPK
jgi:exosome complex component RRP43